MSLRPSTVGTYYSRGECERYIHKAIHQKKKETEPITDSVFKAHTERGNKFEDDLVRKLALTTTVINAENEEPLNSETIMPFIKKHKPEDGNPSTIYFAQFPLAPVTLYGTSTSRAFPDLLRVTYHENDSIHVTIIDIKSSSKAKISHWAQITTYRLILTNMIKDRSVVISTFGEVWIPSNNKNNYSIHEMCLLATTEQIIKLIKTLPKTPTESSPSWNLSSTCGGCDYLNQCRSEAEGTLKAIPLLTKGRFKSLTDIEDLNSNIHHDCSTSMSSDLPETISTGMGDESVIRVDRLNVAEQLSFKTLNDKNIRLRSFKEHLLSAEPPSVYIVISILRDYSDAVGTSKSLVAAVFDDKGDRCESKQFEQTNCKEVLSFLHKQIPSNQSVELYTATDGDRAIFITMLCQEFTNRSATPDEKQILSYIFDADTLHGLGIYTPDLFRGLDTYKPVLSTSVTSSQLQLMNLRRGTSAKGTKESLMKNLLLTFGEEKTLTEGIQEELSSFDGRNGLRAVPYLISTMCCLPTVGYTSVDELYEFFDADFPAETELLTSSLHDIHGMLQARCDSAISVIVSVRGTFQESLKGTPVSSIKSPLELPLSLSNIESYSIQRMIYLKQLAMKTNCTEAVNDRSTGEGLISAKIIDKKKLKISISNGKDLYEKNNSALEEAFRGGAWLASFGSSPESHIFFSDVAYHAYTQNSSGWVPGANNEFLCVADILPKGEKATGSSFKYIREWSFEIDHDSKSKLVLYPDTSNWKKDQRVLSSMLDKFDSLTLSKRVSDFVYDKSLDSLFTSVCPVKGFDKENIFCKVFQNSVVNIKPLIGTPPTPLSESDIHICKETEVLTKSQQEAFNHAINNRLQLVWGPPGTGKTTYLAHAIAKLVELNWESTSYNILVTAVTRAAINELITKVGNLFEGEWAERCLVGFEDRAADVKGQPVVNKPIKVVGTTAWQLGSKNLIFQSPCDGQPKHFKSELPQQFDLIVIDEGSLMVVADTPRIVNSLVPKTGRLFVAGDHLQLPPIQAEVKLKQNNICHTGSILSSLMLTSDELPIRNAFETPKLNLHSSVVKLVDNLRSNDEICNFTSRLYGSDYTVPTGLGISLQLKSTLTELSTDIENTNELAKVLHDSPNWSKGMLTVKIIGEVGVMDEANFIIQLATTLRHLIVGGDEMEIFATVPTRKQRSSITQNNTTTEVLSDIDTVNSMQGRTCNISVAGYCCPSRTEFLYDVRRLNVALTRARSLNVLVVSETVLSPSVSVCDSPNSVLGYQHLRAFVNQSEVIQVQLSPFSAKFVTE